jgi:hypothetical protein
MMNRNGNGRPLSKKKTVQLLVILTIFAWATQTLLHQWGFGQEVAPTNEPQEKFVPGTARFAAGANLEMRSEATIVGGENSVAFSNFNAATVRARKRLQNGVALGVTYIYSHSIDNAGSIGGKLYALSPEGAVTSSLSSLV